MSEDGGGDEDNSGVGTLNFHILKKDEWYNAFVTISLRHAVEATARTPSRALAFALRQLADEIIANEVFDLPCEVVP